MKFVSLEELKENAYLRGIIDELRVQNNLLLKNIDILTAENKRLDIEVKRLKSIIDKDSSNSSKPPSTDIVKKKKNNSRKKSDKSTGGQKGDAGKTLQKVDKPDHVKELISEQCKCGHQFNGSEFIVSEEKRQVFDIPEPGW